MSEPKFTAGPWEVDASGYRAPGGGLCVMAGDLCIAVVQGDSEKPQEANARVIAAAPETLGLLHEAFSMIGPRLLEDVFGYEWRQKAEATLAKVNGE